MRPNPVLVGVGLVLALGFIIAAEAASAWGNGVGWLVLFIGILVAGGVAFHGTEAGFTPRRR